ncbi:nitroreductase family protein [Nocardioides sp. B-3]|nr:nitroreductase family protein [Nocardioides sp. B-3]UUZ61067.1 nitroreductase family protein [Nocardioides sp. B-3]
MYDDAHTLTRAEIDQLLHAAQWAPSAGNSQPWVFFVCERGTANHERLVAHLSRGNAGWVPRASVVFLTAAHVSTGADEDAPAYSDYALYDVGRAAAHPHAAGAGNGAALAPVRRVRPRGPRGRPRAAGDARAAHRHRGRRSR